MTLLKNLHPIKIHNLSNFEGATKPNLENSKNLKK